MKSLVCVDASFGIKIILAEEGSVGARSLWQSWIDNGIQIHAPPLYLSEAASAIRGQVYRNLLTNEEGDQAFRALQAQPIAFSSPPEIHARAWNLAKKLNQPKVYDSYYLALAELLDCEFWTADERLFNSVRQQLPWVKWLGNILGE